MCFIVKRLSDGLLIFRCRIGDIKLIRYACSQVSDGLSCRKVSLAVPLFARQLGWMPDAGVIGCG